MPTSLEDSAVLRQVQLERLKASYVEDYESAYEEIIAVLAAALALLEVDLGKMPVRARNKWMQELEEEIRMIYEKHTSKLVTDNLQPTGGISAGFEEEDIEEAIIGAIALTSVTARQVWLKATTEGMGQSGVLLGEYFSGFIDQEVKRIMGTLRRGYQMGISNSRLLRDIVGTKARNYLDGVLATSRRAARTMVNTATQHVSMIGKLRLRDANPKVVGKYQWVSILDSKTSTICRSLSGQVFENGKGPIPPAHQNCRSSTRAVVTGKFKTVDDDEPTYYDWLKRQSPGFQDEVLGPARGQLFRKSGMSTESFADLNLDKDFKPMTLAEMRAENPKAFKRAGL